MAQLTESVRLEQHREVAVVIVENPPVNALSHHVRPGILDGVKEAEAGNVAVVHGTALGGGLEVAFCELVAEGGSLH